MASSQKCSDFLFFVFVIFVSYSKAGLSKPIAASNLKPSSSVIELISNQQKQPHLQLEAKGTPLSQILDEIAKKTGALIHYSKLSDAPVTATCKGATVGQIMDCLVGKQFSMIAKPAENNKPAEFWLVGTCVDNCQAVAAALQQAPVAKATIIPLDPKQREPTQEMLEQTDQLIEQAKSDDPVQRGDAIANLAGSVGNDPAVRKTLEEALGDKDTNVKIAAVKALTQREGEDANDALQQAFADKNVSVRMAILESTINSPAFLQQALNDGDKTIRTYAQSKLSELAANQNP
ncbi:MAG: HEAT repeat domain-containing protein [Methyloglobulus sp.]|nr:HEAT repeat domain-containing protein [Methyloglobulus sp.]